MTEAHVWPRLHNAMWPGVVGKGDEEPVIDLDTLLTLTANAEVDGVKFDGVDLWMADPHASIDSSADDVKRLAEPTLAHRIIVNPAARIKNVDSRVVVRDLLSTVPVPGAQPVNPATRGWGSRKPASP